MSTTANPQGGDRRVEYMPLDDITPADLNPKRHDLDAIRRSIGRFGFTTPALLDERTGKLVAGHGRSQALLEMRGDGETPPTGVQLVDGVWLVPVLRGWSSRSDAEAQAYLVADNRLTDLGGWNNPELAELLSQVAQVDPDLLTVAGYSEGELDDLLKLVAPPDLDALAGEKGEPEESDTWPIVRVKVPPHVHAAWRTQVEAHGDDEPATLAALLDVDLEKPAAAEWTP